MPEPHDFLNRLTGRTAIVTGAGAEGDEIGIGRAIAIILAGEGARTLCVDIDLCRAQETARMIAKRGGEAIALAADVTSESECAAIVAEAQRHFATLDILVNNVGIAAPLSLDAMDMALWHNIIDTNLTSAMLMSRFAVPVMVQGGGGSIINISSIAGIRAMGSLAYGASKAALHHLSCDIALNYGRRNIRANTVAPGHMATPMAMRLLPAEMQEKRRKVAPLGVEGDAWDIARAVLFLAGEDARFITGVEIPVDGGVTMIGALAGAALLAD